MNAVFPNGIEYPPMESIQIQACWLFKFGGLSAIPPKDSSLARAQNVLLDSISYHLSLVPPKIEANINSGMHFPEEIIIVEPTLKE